MAWAIAGTYFPAYDSPNKNHGDVIKPFNLFLVTQPVSAVKNSNKAYKKC